MTPFYYLNITPTNGSGLCNQLYSIVGTCRHANERSIKYVFVSKFLKQINGSDYCNICDIINIDKTNEYFKTQGVTLIDAYNFDFKVINVLYGTTNITEKIMPLFVKDKSINIGKNINLTSFDIQQNTDDFIFIHYSINNNIIIEEFETKNGFLLNDININFNNLKFIPTLKTYNDGTKIFRDFIRNIVFNDAVVNKTQNYINNSLIKQHTKINIIHLRLEDDAIQHWGKECKFTNLKQFKSLLENKYINIIKQFIDKDSLTIILASNYDNEVIKYMTLNYYNFIIPPKLDENRDISAIHDLLIGETCNNVCIGVQESTYTYTLFFRISHIKPDVQNINLHFTDINHPGSILHRFD